MNRPIVPALLAALCLSGAAAQAAIIPVAIPAASFDDAAQSREEEAYERAREAIDDEQWQRAIEGFDRVIAMKGSRADVAMYWKAYAQNRAGQRAEALNTLAELNKAFPRSRTREEARALEIEIRNAGGQTVDPTKLQDEEIKLYALQALAHQDPAEAVPMLEKILKGGSSPKLKERALFVLAQMSDSRARQVLASAAKDDAHPEIQSKAIQYLGVHGGSENRALLAEVYQTSTNVSVKKRVLRAWMVSGEKARIVAAASGEKDPELRAEAIQQLGVMGGQDELAKLYAQETAKDVKKRILQAMFIGGRSDRLLELAKSETDPELRRTAVRNLGLMGAAKTGAALVEIYNTEKDPAVRRAVIEGLFLQNNAEALVALARKENDAAMKGEMVRKLSLMGRNKVAMDYLMELLK
ncbi:MAG TPA: HEAT repeat domain-containing protein [Vicinamibacterales bacterium]|nr:HEAT repeat domain-containing protein [Vicinamibacterales bacterium]